MIYGKPIILVSFVLLFDMYKACPLSCVCKWKNGKQTVECNNRDLLIIPDGIDSGTQVLEFNGNNLQALHNEKFLKLNLVNLQRIYMSRCRIKIIYQRTFKGLTNLVELDLSNNMLENVPAETFLDCPSLMRLTLSDNPIKTLRKAAFNHLSFLSTLELSNCELSRVDENAFQGLLNLEWLHLDGNKLTAMSGLGILRKSLKGIQLQNNPWECDCHLTSLHGWLLGVNTALTVEPICSGPARLFGHPIKSIPTADLACLPDVSPTTFYLEISEGKNISLLCSVRAIPPARVSWWFEGRLLQNDSIIAPGIHLLYYIEKGVTEKKSELVIFNTNAADNGTFVCSAENAAGISQANFTIRVVLKELSAPGADLLPLEQIIILMSAAAGSVLILLLIIILLIAKCSKSRRKMNNKREVSKPIILHSNKDNFLLQEGNEEYNRGSKEGTVITSVSTEYLPMEQNTVEQMLTSLPPVIAANAATSPTSIRYFSLEQNPDLINGTESIGRRYEGDGTCGHQAVPEKGADKMLGNVHSQWKLYTFSQDMRLDPIGLLCQGETRGQQSCYKTLPHNRLSRRHSAANPPNRFSREAEFLARGSHSASYEHYCPDVRYTADGYPVRTSLETAAGFNVVCLPSPPESHKSDSVVSSMATCCPGAAVQWPSCVPAGLLKLNQDVSTIKKSVGAQTQTECDEARVCASAPNRPVNKSVCNVVNYQEVLTESPDEGYEGESLETNTS